MPPIHVMYVKQNNKREGREKQKNAESQRS